MLTYFIAKLNFSKQGIKIGTLQSQILQSLFTHGINGNHTLPSVSVSSAAAGGVSGLAGRHRRRHGPTLATLNTRDAASQYRDT